MQTRLGSVIEVAGNLVVGYSVNFLANWTILPLFGITGLTLGKNIAIGLVFTVISIGRQYVLRRFFNGLKFGRIPDVK